MTERVESTAASLDLIVEEGSTFSLPLTWMNEEEDLIQLTGYKAVLQVREFANAKNVLLEMSSDNGRIILGEDGTETEGQILLKLTRDETADLGFDQGKYQLELEQGDETIRLLRGRFIVDKEIVE